MIILKNVTYSDIDFLFELLKQRDPIANISHKKMPSFSQHSKFVKSKPYSKWYIVYLKKISIGSVYLSKNNEIGISLLKSHQKKNIEKQVLNKIIHKNPRKRFLANVSPKNKDLISFFLKNNFKLIQFSFEKIK